MKQHEKRNETHPTTKILYNQIDVSALKKMLEKDDLFEDSIEVWKIYQLLLRMKNKSC